ncbi:serine/threonine protein kinase [Pseudonocardia sp. DSM 110487]|uniref:serine/threonine-protein kinase n=1 Tax=Pseudonocardia sp. DSM 110487 TaxID=2865833 RepID=UPI001C6A328A|nr:serine/threonine-protein kinase [Pseudonocardia sp. DSM 110487]QYN39005.1 serine/threonine protein kinase [Pseudonocardia sp. DSM 110487]
MTGIPDGAPVAVVAGRYRLRELVGTGGMGAVWRASDELLGREVALKQVRLADQPVVEIALARERTMREARIAASLHHPHIVSIFDVVLEDGEPWLVLEFLLSRSLGSVLAERGTLPPAEVAAIGADVADALAAAHAAGIVHRDVKPDNVLLSRPSAAGPVVKLTDFGIAHSAAAPAITATHVLTGTPAYFAPETARGEGTDARSDVYSLGATLYAAVEGHPPFDTDTGDVLALLARIGRGGVPRPQRAGPLTDLLGRLTADDPAARPTAAQAQAALREIAGGVRPPAATTVDADPQVRAAEQQPDAVTFAWKAAAGGRPRRGLRVAVASAAVLAAVAAVIVAVVVARPGDPDRGSVAAPSAAATAARGVVGIADPAAADPCTLIDVASLQTFGPVTVDPDNAQFAGCRADIAQYTGGSTAFHVSFENETEAEQVSGGRPRDFGDYTVVSYDPEDGFCQQRILLPDGHAIEVSATSRDDSGYPDLCPIVDVGRAGTLALLDRQGIGVRPRPTSAGPLADTAACSLLDPADLSAAVRSPTPPRPWFADWGCDWTSYTGDGSVELVYNLGHVLGESGGTRTDFAGHPGVVLAQPGYCRVEFAQRAYVAGGSDRVESVQVIRRGSGSDAELCQAATTLATAAAGKLPPPG